MKKKNLTLAGTLACMVCCCMFVLTSCEKDEPAPETPETDIPEDVTPLNFEANPRAFALKFTDYIGDGAENIKLLDADTVRIAINEGLLTCTGIGELQVGDALNIWQNIDCPPYIRVVDAVERDNAWFVVTTREGSISDLFTTFEANLDTELYCNLDRRPSRPDTGGSDELDHFVDDAGDFRQFVSEEGKIHPFIFFTPDEENPRAFRSELAEHRYDAMVDSLAIRGPSWDKNWNIINTKVEHLNFYPKRDEEGNGVGLFVADASVAMAANLEMYFQFNLFKSNRFWDKFKGDIDLQIPVHLSFEGSQIQGEYEVPLYEFTPKFTAFSLGPFVVPVVFRHGIVFKSAAAINSNFSMMAPIYYKNSFEKGPKYENKKWSSFDKSESSFGVNREKFSILPSYGASVSANTGIYYHVGAYLGSAIGPFFEIGPKATIAANTSINGKQLSCNTRATIGLGGFVGAEIKVWKWNLGKFSVPYYAVSKDLWKEDYTFDLGDLPWKNQGGAD